MRTFSIEAKTMRVVSVLERESDVWNLGGVKCCKEKGSKIGDTFILYTNFDQQPKYWLLQIFSRKFRIFGKFKIWPIYIFYCGLAIDNWIPQKKTGFFETYLLKVQEAIMISFVNLSMPIWHWASGQFFPYSLKLELSLTIYEQFWFHRGKVVCYKIAKMEEWRRMEIKAVI